MSTQTEYGIKFIKLKMDLIKYEIEFDEYHACISDCIYELFEILISITDLDLMAKLYDMIPRDLRIDVMKWGIYDTEVRDNIYLEFKKNKDKLIEIIKC